MYFTLSRIRAASDVSMLLLSLLRRGNLELLNEYLNRYWDNIGESFEISVDTLFEYAGNQERKILLNG